MSGGGPNGGQNPLSALLGGSNPMAQSAQQGQSVSPQAGAPVPIPQSPQGAKAPMAPDPAQQQGITQQMGNNPYQAFLTALQQVQNANPATAVQKVTPPVAPSWASQQVGYNNKGVG
jgi:hypothetical protein